MAPMLAVASALLLSLSSPAIGAVIDSRALSGYAPQTVTCPSGSLVRGASSLSAQESAFVSKRAPKASENLKAWLSKIDSSYGNATKLPTVALGHSGGGYRSLLISAGAVQALDGREGTGPLNGLLQGLTYQAGISGGSWFLSSLFGNNYPTVSYLQKNLWTDAFAESVFLTELFHFSAEGNTVTDVAAKQAAGFPISIVDPYGRLLSYQLLQGPDGGVSNTLSGLSNKGNFTTFDIPYPIINAVGVDTTKSQCAPSQDAIIYELTPYEFGSWGPGVSAFTPSVSLGSTVNNGQASKCVSGFDNLGFAFGTSSDIFFELVKSLGNSCGPNATLGQSQGTSSSGLSALTSELEGLLGSVLGTAVDASLFAHYPNPFKGYASASSVSAQTQLALVDGGGSGQNVPINPFIQPARAVDVLIVTDASADTAANYPDGTAVHETYLQSLPQNLNLPKMPVIPDNNTFIAKGLNTRPGAFGCNDPEKITLVYMPNYNYTYQQAGESTYKLEYTPQETAAMIRNGNAVATQNGNAEWPVCLSCIVMKKTGEALPAGCGKCFDDYCYN